MVSRPHQGDVEPPAQGESVFPNTSGLTILIETIVLTNKSICLLTDLLTALVVSTGGGGNFVFGNKSAFLERIQYN